MTVAERRKLSPRGLPRGPMIMTSIGAIAIIIIPLLLFKRVVPQNYYTILGPVLGSAVTLLAIGLSDIAKYYSSTTTLSHELDVECGSYDCRRGRISAIIKNEGRVVVRDAKGVVSINRGQSLAGLLIENVCGMLVNPVNPHVNGEALAWALPEKPVYMPAGLVLRGGNVLKKYVEAGMDLVSALISISLENNDEKKREIIDKVAENIRGLTLPLFTTYNHVTSISPGQRNRLLIFDYEYNWWSNSYLIKVHSEYGGPGPGDITPRPYRACLLLDDSTKYEFEITVNGEGLREPFLFKMSVVKDKLDALAKSFKIKDISNVDVVMDVLSEFEEDGDDSLIDRYWRIRNRILEVKSLDEYKSVAKELESLWKSVKNKLGSKAPYFGIATGILNSYLVYLAAIGKQGEAKKLFTENKETLEREIESNVLTRLMLRLFEIKEIKVETKELIEILEKRRIYVPIPSDYSYIHIDKDYAPAVKFLFGVYKSKDEALNECNGNNLCKRIVEAASGDTEALNELKSDKIRQSSENKELKQLLSNLKAKSFILAYLPSTPYARFALMLYELIEGDAESVKALAYVGWKMPSRYAPLMMQVERYKQLPE